MKKTLIIFALLWALVLALIACDTAKPSGTDTHDTAEIDTPSPDETVDTLSESDGEKTEEPASSEPLPDESHEPTPSETDTETSTPSDTLPEETVPPEPEETVPPEPEETGPGKLVYVSNDVLRYMDSNGTEIGYAFDPGQYDTWTKRSITVGKDQVSVFVDWGWAALDSKSYEFGYIVNGEFFFSEIYAREPEEAVVKAATQKGAKNCARYCGGLTAEVLKMGDNAVQFCVRLDGDVLCVLREYTVTLTQQPVRLDGSFWLVDMDTWTVTGHAPGLTSKDKQGHGPMVAAGGMDQAALLHQGAIGIGTVDLSKYSKVIVYYGCDNGATTQNHYNNSPHNRIIISRVDTDMKNSPAEVDIIASETYALRGWAPYGLEIDLTGINYNGPVYITMDTLPGTFMLITAIEFIGAGKSDMSDKPDTPDTPDEPEVPDTPDIPAEGNYAPALSDWEVSGHKKGLMSANDPSHGAMVRAGGVDQAALLHQGAIGIGTVDLSKYSKVVVYYGCDNSGVTENHYKNNPNNRIMITRVDTDGQNSPDEKDIIAAETYALRGWAPYGLEIDLTGIDYKGPVYITVDALPGTFVLITAIEFVK